MNGNSPLTLDERRELLILACELDRLNLRLAMRPTPLERLTLSALEQLAPLAPHLPGRIGKWTRGIMRGTHIFKGIYDAVSR
jgi:hypothetical protein